MTPCLPSLRAGLVAAVLFGVSVAPAQAVCPICNSAVRFDGPLALCFQQRAEDEIRRAESDGRGFVIVDLSDCERDTRVRSGGLPTDPKLAATLDDSFVADAESLRCLGDAIARHTGAFDPAVLFDLTEQCP